MPAKIESSFAEVGICQGANLVTGDPEKALLVRFYACYEGTNVLASRRLEGNLQTLYLNDGKNT